MKWLMKNKPVCESNNLTLLHRLVTIASACCIDRPKASSTIGELRRVNSFRSLTLICGRSDEIVVICCELNWLSGSISHFRGLRWSPISLNLGIRIPISWKTLQVGPASVPSSRYHKLISLFIYFIIGSMAREKSNGPMGSPCWTPVFDIIL